MNLVDSHTHIYFEDFEPSPSDAVRRAIDAGVTHMVLPGVNLSTVEPIKKLHSLFPENTSMAIGLHPGDIYPEKWKEEMKAIEEELRNSRDEYKAVGEVGVDLHWETKNIDLQQLVFEHQCNLAVELDLPVIIHSRDAFSETYEVLKGVKGLQDIVFHSFSGTPGDVEDILSLFPTSYFGINGIVTFKNSKLKDVLKVIPDDRLLLETDSPYLAPVPKRGQRNESSYLVHTARFIAAEKGMEMNELAQHTTMNAKRFFRL